MPKARKTLDLTSTDDFIEKILEAPKDFLDEPPMEKPPEEELPVETPPVLPPPKKIRKPRTNSTALLIDKLTELIAVRNLPQILPELPPQFNHSYEEEEPAVPPSPPRNQLRKGFVIKQNVMDYNSRFGIFL